MKRVLPPLTLGLLLFAAPAQAQEPAQLLVQSSPLAGFRYYEAQKLWDEMRVGDALALVREPGNPYDANAVRVEWRGRLLGYVPRRENAKVAANLDRGVPLAARVTRKEPARAPSRRIEFEIYLGLAAAQSPPAIPR